MDKIIDKAGIHGYLSGDGKVIYRKTKWGTNYEISFYPDHRKIERVFIEKMFNVFAVRPKVYRNSKKILGCVEVRCFSKKIYNKIIEIGKYGTFDWKIPKWTLNNLNALKEWIKCFFDSEAYVNLHEKRIQIKSVNEKGLNQICKSLKKFGIKSKVYGPYFYKKYKYFQLEIPRKCLYRFEKYIGFNHPNKLKNLRLICWDA